MDKENRAQDPSRDPAEETTELLSRRAFLGRLKNWSKAVVGGLLLAGTADFEADEAEAATWINRRGGGWYNRARRGGSWSNRGGSWANAGGGWYNRGSRGGWMNGGGGGWINRRGGYGWINRR